MPDTNTNYIFGTGSIPINIKSAQLATFADGTTKQQGYEVAEVNKLISTMLTGWDANGNKPKSMSDNYLELILSCDNGFVVKKRLQFPHIIAWKDDSTQYQIADVYKEFSIDNWLKADDFENPDITLVVEPIDEILTTSTATPPEATTTNSGRFYLYYRNLPVGINRIHIDFHIKTKTEPIDFDLEVIDGLSWKDAQIILSSNEQVKVNVLLGTVKDVYNFTGAEGNFEEITLYEWSALYQQIISLAPSNKFTHDLYFYLYEESELNMKITELERNTIPLHISLPMISKKSNLKTATLETRIFTPETISAFLLDMKLIGTPETGCTYDLEFQYAKTGAAEYFNCLYLYKQTTNGTRSGIGTYLIGKNAPTGVKIFEFTTTDSHITKCSVVLDYRALLDIVETQGTYARVRLASNWGYQFDQTYLFDTDDKNSILYYLQHIDTTPMNIPIENVDTSIWDGTPTVATYPDAIKELFVSPAFLNGVTRLTIQRYMSSIYLVAFINDTIVFKAINDMSSWQNNITYPLEVTIAGANANVGDIVGYVVFSDVSKFTNTSKASNLRINVVKSISAFGNRSENFIHTFLMQHPEFNERSWGHYGLPMVVKSSKLVYIKNSNSSNVISPLTFSQFLLDMKLVGTREPNAQYRFARFQHRSNAGGPNYANYIEIRKSTDNWTSETNIVQYQVGSTPPSGTNIIELDTTDSYITKVKLLMNWDVLKDIDVFTKQTYGKYNVPKSYIFDTEYMLNQDLGIIPNIESHKVLVGDKTYGLEIQLPNVIYAVVGTELNLWNDAIAYSMDKGLQSPMNYSVGWYSNVGTVTNRCYRFTPIVENAGNTYSLTCYLYDVNGKQVSRKTVQIKVLAKNALATAKNIVYFGDSLGASAAFALYSNFDNADKFTGTKPTMLGTRGTTYHYEAVGGYRWADYATQGRRAFRCYVSELSSTIPLQAQYTNNGFTWRIVEVNITEGSGNILITKYDIGGTDSPETNGTLISTTGVESIPYTNATLEGANPLWNPSTQQIDVAYYKQHIGLSVAQKIDAVSFQFGINDSYLAYDLTTLHSYIQTLYNAFIEDNPDCLFIIGLTTTSGNDADGSGANYGASIPPIKYNDRVFRIRQYYLTLQGNISMPNIRIAPIHPQVDRYYGYNFGTRPISQRYTQTEQYHTNYVHPGESGYGQMGDAYFAAFVGALVE